MRNEKIKKNIELLSNSIECKTKIVKHMQNTRENKNKTPKNFFKFFFLIFKIGNLSKSFSIHIQQQITFNSSTFYNNVVM